MRSASLRRTASTALTCVLVLWLAAVCEAAGNGAALGPPDGFCPRVGQAPKIDGRLDDACWRKAGALTPFFLRGQVVAARGRTEALCARDDKALYVAVKCYVNDLGRRKARETRRDGRVWMDDCIEIFLVPAAKPGDAVRFQFIVNAIGTIFDARSDMERRAWTSGMRVALGTVPKSPLGPYWVVETAFPFSDLTRTPKPGDVWRLNFCRTASQFGEMSVWAPILKGGNDQPELFGRLHMRAPTKADAAARAAYVRRMAPKAPPADARTATALPLTPGRPTLITKVPVVDCRVLKAFAGDPVDGTTHSLPYAGYTPREYPSAGVGAGVSYHYNRCDGLHVLLGDEGGFDAAVMRHYARTKMYADVTHVAKPRNGKLLWTFVGAGPVEVAALEKRAMTRRVSFFQTTGGQIADLAFYRVKPGADAPGVAEAWGVGPELRLAVPKAKFAPERVYNGLIERFDPPDRRAFLLWRGEPMGSLAVAAGRAVHFLSRRAKTERGLAAVGIEAEVDDVKGPYTCTLIVNDPLNPRRNLAFLPFTVSGPGALRPTVDIPDQVVLKGSRLWVTLKFDKPVTLTGAGVRLFFIPREQARPEAIAHRRFLMRTLFGPVSEPRPWGRWKGKMTREEFFTKTPYSDRLPEFFMTIDQCHAIDPKDDLTRQFREWIYYRRIKQSEVPLPPKPLGAPEWAWYPRLAWLEARRITNWWMEERMVPTGEVGVAGIQDDGDLYQQFADLPYFETGGLAAKLRDCAMRIAELCERDHLKGGINTHATDALHAYEEGINHLALMARWFYGDPIYLERCMVSARNMEKLTIVTPDGRRHFRSTARMGYDDVLRPRKPGVAGHSGPLMWHTTLQTADYNRNPRALKTLREWADSWLKLNQPPQWATAVEVMSGKVTRFSKDRPLYGGYRSQAVTNVWLHAMTGDKRYLEPFFYYYRKGRLVSPANRFMADVLSAGGLDGFDKKTLQRLSAASPEARLYIGGEVEPLMRTIIGNPKRSGASVNNLCDAIRFPDMYTITHQYTDRVLLGMLQAYASMAYLGGYCKRNKYNPTQALSWEGFGTEYGALVLKNRRSGVKAAAYNFSTTTRVGAVRVWNLEHGLYRITIGVDDNRDFKIDRPIVQTTRELLRADRLAVEMRPEVVTIIEVEQVKRLDPIHTRADLAVAAREVAVDGDALKATAHNLGSSPVANVEVAVLDANDKVVARKSLGRLDAPLDLVPRRKAFSLALPKGVRKGWRLVLDPSGRVPEIYEGNNTVALDDLPAVDYRKGWE